MHVSPLLATLLAAASCLLLLFGVTALARRRAGYSHIRHTISELGETGAKDFRLVAYGLFLPVAILLLSSAAAVWNYDQTVAMLPLCMGIGYLVAVIAPCDPGSPLEGSWKQYVHNLGGAIEYVGGALALWTISNERGSLFFVCGWIVALGTVAISIPRFPARGLLQRVVEATLFACVTYGGWLAIT